MKTEFRPKLNSGVIKTLARIFLKMFTVFENQRKSLIQHCERSELHLHFEWTKVHLKNAINGPIFKRTKIGRKWQN